MRKLFYGLNFAMLAIFIAALVVDQKREWHDYQERYNEMDVERLEAKLAAAKTAAAKEQAGLELAGAKRRRLEIKQIMADDLKRVDRCVTCHVGMDEFTNPSLTNEFKENPYKGHPGDIHKTHSFKKFGCTSCHAGQGLALTVADAHGFVKHWEQPLLKAPYLQASCAKCHANFERLPGAQVAAKGKQLFEKHGCIGCHSMNGVGGVISVDLADIADKPLSRIDFSHAHLDRHDWNIQNWIELHLTKDPAEMTPGDPEGHLGEPIPPSGMPDFRAEIDKAGAQAITAYLLSRTAEKIPHDFFVYAPPAREPSFSDPVQHGKYVFQKYGCAGCHGLGGAKGRRNFNAMAPGQTDMAQGLEPTLTDVVGTYSREELKAKISEGVPASAIAKFKADGPTPPLYMPAWKDKIKGQELEDLVTYLLSIAKKEESW